MVSESAMSAASLARHVRDEGAGEAELLGLLEPRRRLGDRPHHARERNFAEIDRIGGQGRTRQ